VRKFGEKFFSFSLLKRRQKKKRHVSSARGTGLSSSFVSSRARSRAEGEEEQKVFVFARVVFFFIVTFFFCCCRCCSFERGDDDELETPEERRFPGKNSISKRVRVDEERKKCDRVQSDGGREQRRRWQRREYVRARAEKSVG
jgi:hypothetical protein